MLEDTSRSTLWYVLYAVSYHVFMLQAVTSSYQVHFFLPELRNKDFFFWLGAKYYQFYTHQSYSNMKLLYLSYAREQKWLRKLGMAIVAIIFLLILLSQDQELIIFAILSKQALFSHDTEFI